MSPTKSTAVATGTSNGRTLITMYDIGCETSLGALTRRAVKLGDSPGISEMNCVLKPSVTPSSSVTIYRKVLPQVQDRRHPRKKAYIRMNNNAAKNEDK